MGKTEKTWFDKLFDEMSVSLNGFGEQITSEADPFVMVVMLLLIVLILYPYLIYPIILKLLNVFRHGDFGVGTQLESAPALGVSFLICVYNGESLIEKKINNILSLDNYQDSYNIYIISDCSTDKTDEIVKNYPHPSVRLIRCPERYGKTRAENYALSHVSSDILIFSDTSTLFNSDLLIHVLPHFKNPKIGCVSTCDRIVCASQGTSMTTSREGLYVKYEMLLRKLETRLGVLTGASGSCFACRKQLAIDIPSHLTRDLHVPLYCYQHNMIAVSEDKAVCQVPTKNDLRSEISRKIRTFTNGIDTLLYMKQLLNPFKYGLFAFCLLSHKYIRWLGGVLMGFLYGLSLINIDNSSIAIFFTLQTLLYVYCILRYFGRISVSCSLCDAVYFFVLVNFSAIVAWYNHFCGNSYAFWEPTQR